jgi:hypothetical protein
METLKTKLESLARRIEQVRVNSKLPAYQQAELTEIKYTLKTLADEQSQVAKEAPGHMPRLPSVYNGMTQAEKDQAHAIQVRQMMRDGV